MLSTSSLEEVLKRLSISESLFKSTLTTVEDEVEVEDSGTAIAFKMPLETQ